MRKATFAAVRNKHPRGYELPKEKNATPNEGDGHHGVRFGNVAWLNSHHLNDVTGSDIEVGKNIRENPKLPPPLRGKSFLGMIDFQKISREAMVDLGRWRSL